MEKGRNSNELHSQNNKELLEKRKWEAPELFILETDNTLTTANNGFDGVTVS